MQNINAALRFEGGEAAVPNASGVQLFWDDGRNGMSAMHFIMATFD